MSVFKNSKRIKKILNKLNVEILHGDCCTFMLDGTIKANSIDLTVTSPPYDNLRTYDNKSIWDWGTFCNVVKGLWHVTKPGGVIVWVVSDATIKGSETGTSFKQALYFKKYGFSIHDTMIYLKKVYVPRNHNRYEQAFEYMFVFSKGRPKTFNPIKISKKTNDRVAPSAFRQPDGSMKKVHIYNKNPISKTKIKSNCWGYTVGYMHTTKDKIAYKHPAMFPEQLVYDHIISWSNIGDVVFDPFLGSGTTGKVAVQLKRNFIGCEINKKYVDLSNKRIAYCK